MAADIVASVEDGALHLVIDRASALNALTTEAVAGLAAEVAAVRERRDIRVVFVRGAGDKAFCAGIDLKQRQALAPLAREAQSKAVLELNLALRELDRPVVALIDGWCLGAGLELALACDLRFATPEARFGFPEMTLGAYPGGGGAVFLPRLIGRSRALQWLLEPRKLGAEEALAMGLVDRVVARDELNSAARQLVASLHATAPLAVAALKRSIDGGAELPLRDAQALDQSLRRPLDATRDYEEGLRAHLEKRKPVFTGA